jgi:copper(I)-binding protein
MENIVNLKLLTAALIIAACMFSCTDKKQEESKTEVDSNVQAKQITIENIWTRVGAEKGNSAMYFDIVNNTPNDDTLINASSDAADLVEVHETYKKDEDRMGMRRVERVPVPAKSTTRFKPMGHHVMLIKLTGDLKLGDTVNAVLTFQNSGEIKISSMVKDMIMQH